MAKQPKTSIVRDRPLTAGSEKLSIPPAPDAPPPGLPTDPREFWGIDFDPSSLPLPEKPDSTPALQRLGPPPFPRGKFPLVGFLATVYEHVAGHAREALGIDSPDRRGEKHIKGE